MSEAPKLRPCPFCGSRDIDDFHHGIRCRECGAWMGASTIGDYSVRWSRRIPCLPDELVERLDDARHALDEYAGDTDLDHFENDDEWREGDPVTWACAQISRILNAVKGER